MLTKVISGGQTGVDQAALRAAGASGLAIGGWCPPGRVCHGGTIPDDLPLVETPEERSPLALDVPRSLRTEWNVRDSDATLILRCGVDDGCGPGTAWTIQCAARYGRPLLVCDPTQPISIGRIEEWLAGRRIRVLNVAGPSEATQPGIADEAVATLTAVFSAGRAR